VCTIKLTEFCHALHRTASAPPAGRRIQTRRSGVHGKGVFALQDIAEGDVLIEYTGEIITWQEAQDRHPHDPAQPNHTFYFHVDEDRVIDAQIRRQRLALDQPQLQPQLLSPTSATAASSSPRCATSQAGEELNYDYGLIIDERYTAEAQGRVPLLVRQPQLPRHPAGAQARLDAAEALGGKPKKGARQGALKHEPARPALARRPPSPRRVAPLLPGLTVEAVPEIDSTNTELMRRARAGQTAPVLLTAEAQTAGRGRLGRGWQRRPPGASLAFSLGLPLAPAGLVGPVAGRGA
jgi:hypothetical protein